jgi:hypothetical protein
MDVFTMLIIACIDGEARCEQRRISEMSFTTRAACEERIDAEASAMTKSFSTRPGMKGRRVVYDVACLDGAQLRARLGVASADI